MSYSCILSLIIEFTEGNYISLYSDINLPNHPFRIFLYIQATINLTNNMLGELLYQGKGRLAGSRILNADEYRVEHSMIEEGKFKNVEITLLGTFWTVPAGKNVTYVEGQGIITTKDGEDTATFRGYGIGNSRGQVSVSFRGSVIYKSSSTNGKLSFLNNKIGVFESEVDESGTSTEQHWEWK